MGLKEITHRDDGSELVPQSRDDWQEWVSATSARNFVLNDPILDWLDRYGKDNGFLPDDELDGYDHRTSFLEFIFRKGHEFEAAVVSLVQQKVPITEIPSGPGNVRNLNCAEQTLSAMVKGDPVISQGVLWDPQHQTYGAPDLLVRSDVLLELYPELISAEEAAIPAPDTGNNGWHYRIVDIKFTTLGLTASGVVDNSGSAPAYKTQLYIYNRALGRIQGYEPPESYLLGRGWKQGNDRGNNCLERLGPISQAGSVANGYPIAQFVLEANNWILRLRSEGAGWNVLPSPSVPELYPNAGNQSDAPWHVAKGKIVEELKELSRLPQVGVPGRKNAHAVGVFHWDDPSLTSETVSVTGPKRQRVLKEVIAVNVETGPVVRPSQINAEREVWHPPGAIEFYVDFEYVSDLSDDFSHLPDKGGQPLIFMIGCGHLEDSEWRFESFTVDELSEPAEATIINSWVDHMESVRARLAPDLVEPLLFHWSPAEVTTLQNAYNSAKDRHPEENWPSLNWFDFLVKVVRAEPLVVKGAFGFGLKAISSALHFQEKIKTLWGDGPADGLGAMAAAWWCAEESKANGVPLGSFDLMQGVIEYNEVDCKVMMEIIRYLRANH